jgi:flagellar basal-body rod protein FlgC
MEGVFSTIKISGTGLSVQRHKMNVVAENIANAETTSTEEGGPYRRKSVEVTAAKEKLPFQTILKNKQASLHRTRRQHMPGLGSKLGNRGEVSVAEAEEKVAGADAFKLVFDPSHPEADEEGYVKMPDIEIINEMVDMMAANRAYEANAMAVTASKEMIKQALDI